MLMRGAADRMDAEPVPESWWVRRKILLALATLVPVLLITYSLVASLIAAPGTLGRDGGALIFGAFLIMSMGAYVMWTALVSLVRVSVPSRCAHGWDI